MNLDILYALQLSAVSAAEGGSASQIIAQVITTLVGFGIVYWILKTYAFGPILSVLDERSEKVESDLQRAEDLRNQAEADKKALEDRLQNLEAESREKMLESINEGKRIASNIQEEARKKADEMIANAERNIQFEMEKARVELKEDIINLTLQSTEKLIQERLDDDKHKQLIGNFLEQIERN